MAAGVSAIVGSAIVAAFSVFMLFAFNAMKLPETQPAAPAYLKSLMNIVWLFFIAAAIYVCACGIGVMRLERWARISLMVVAGVMLFFSLTGVFVAIVVFFVSPLPGPPVENIIVGGILVLIYGVPLAIALWWLILFTRRPIVVQFEAYRADLAPSRPIQIKKPGCPLPIAIVAWFLLSTVLNVLILPFLPFPIPVILFGHVFHGPIAWTLLLGQFGLLTASSIGLLRLQRWSYPVGLGLQLFYIANLVVTSLNSSFTSELRPMISQLHVPAPPAGFPDVLQYARYFSLAGLIVPLACAVCLIYSREAFFAATLADLPGTE